jgi:iron complex outermembrane receptor protein
MNKLFYFLFLLSSFQLASQNTINGVVVDKKTTETLIGANIVLFNVNNQITIGGAVTNIDGEFEFNNLSNDTYSLTVSYIGYESENIILKFNEEDNLNITVELKPDVLLDVVSIIGDQAEFRKTPVSLSNVKLEKIEKELAGQEIPILLNSTPGVYATQQGGGDGDVRINIRGFNQRNVAVMIDGVPMNDMENGWVYWSNWFGLDALTRTIQVQRGLGASKLALPSVGGTINIITKGVNAKEGGMIKQEYGSGNYLRTSFAYTTKNFKLGKFNFAGSFKRSDGLVDQTPSKGFFYYLKWQKQIKNHLFSFSVFGAPQEHGQRKYQTGIAVYDKDFATELGIDTASLEGGYGLTYNPNWGEYNDYEVIYNNGTPVDTIFGKNTKVNRYKNYYHKPNFNFQHLWQINENSSLTNVLYYSMGRGGGTGLNTLPIGADGWTDDNQINFQYMYDSNSGNIWNSFINPGGPAIDLAYSDLEKKSTYILYSSINNHYWTGLLSTFNHQINKKLNLASGIDLRTYTGEHYREIYDLLGGDYYAGSGGSGANNSIGENSNNLILREGDKIYYHNDGLVHWLGGFGQLEYNHGNISAFLNITASQTAYKRIDYFKKQDLVLEDTIMTQAIGINDTITYNETEYTIDSNEARFSETNWENFLGYTIKTGANWNIDENNNIFINTGLLSKAPRFSNVFNYNNEVYYNIENEIVKAIELGYGYKSKTFSLNFNTYNTIWENKPQSGRATLDGGESVDYNINGIDALHQGIEIDFAWKISNNLKYEFLSSLGNWKWNSGDTVNFYLNQQLVGSDYFDAEGVYVGDSPQTQIGSSISYNFWSGAEDNGNRLNRDNSGYIKLKVIYFDRFYSDYDPFTLNENKEVWQIPGYALFSLHMGNTIYFENSNLNFKLNILNLFNTTYISDAQNNSSYVEDAPMNSGPASASVFFGMGRKLITSIEYKF